MRRVYKRANDVISDHHIGAGDPEVIGNALTDMEGSDNILLT